MGLQKGASELDAGDLASLVGGIFGLSKFGRDDDGSGGWRGKDDDTGKGAEGVIKPSLPPDPDRKPEGKPTKIDPDVSAVNADTLKAENDAALVLAQNGWRVEQNPDPNKLPDHIQASGTKPDYVIEGVVMDCYTPQSTASVRNIWDNIRSKVERGQADGVVLNLENRTDMSEIIEFLTNGDIGIQGIRTIIVVKDDKAVVIYPRE